MFRKIGLALCGIFYKLIPAIYDVFYDIAGAKFFDEEVVRQLSNNIYILVSVAMLFAMGVQLIKAIVNPDLLLDNKKGTTAFLKRAFLSIIIITLVPIAFTELYELQNTILEKSLVEKLIVGYSGNKDELKVGQYIAGVALSEMLYPVDGASMEEDADALNSSYNLMINEDVNKYFDDMYDYIAIKDKSDSAKEKYVLHFDFLACLLVGVLLCYMLIINCIDIALRMVKLSLLELVAPISIVAYILQGEKSLESWVKEVSKTYATVFVKIAALSFATFGIQQLPKFMEDKTNYSHPWIIKMLILIGLLMLVNELPNLISTLFGVDFQWKGGIKGRLGQMKGVGNIAQKAWGAIASPKGIAAAGAGLVSGIGGAIGHNVAVGKNVKAKLKDGKKGEAFLTGAGGILTSGSAAIKSAQKGFKNRNLSGIGSAYRGYVDSHPKDSTVFGRVIERGRSFVGLDEHQKAMEDDLKSKIKKGNGPTITDPNTGASRIVGRYVDLDNQVKYYDENQFTRDSQKITDRIADYNRQKKIHSDRISQVQDVNSKIKAIKDEAKSQIQKANSTITASQVNSNGSLDMKIFRADGTTLKDSQGKDMKFKSIAELETQLTTNTSLTVEDKAVLQRQIDYMKLANNNNFNASQMSTYIQQLKNTDTTNMTDAAKQKLVQDISIAERVLVDIENAASATFTDNVIAGVDGFKNTIITDNVNNINASIQSDSGSYAYDVASSKNVTSFNSFVDMETFRKEGEDQINTENNENYKIDNEIRNVEIVQNAMNNAKSEVDEAINELKRDPKYVAAGEDTKAIKGQSNDSSGN